MTKVKNAYHINKRLCATTIYINMILNVVDSSCFICFLLIVMKIAKPIFALSPQSFVR